jgi:hypothetical protein
MNNQKIQKWFHLNIGKLSNKIAHDALILFQAFRGKQELNLAVTPGFRDLMRPTNIAAIETSTIS